MLRAAAVLVIAVVSAAAPGAPAPASVDEAALARITAPPLGLPPVPFPLDNPPTAEKIALGRKLFFDRRLSRNGTMSCAMCHVPEQGFTSHELSTPIGVEGRSLRRNAPTILNVAYQARLFHDGRETTLETQAIAPLIAREEMANPSIGAVLERLATLPDYAGRFEAAFGAGPSVDRIGQAIASWERAMLAANSPFDRWRYGGEGDAMTPQQIRGFELFTGKAGCVACHTVGDDHALFTDHSFHDTGIGYRRDRRAARTQEPVPVQLAPGVVVPVARALIDSVGDPPVPDFGRLEVTERPADRWRFRTPSLRNVALTAPYMHDGSMRTLEGVVRYYDQGGERHAGLDARIRPLGLAEDDVAALVAFLGALTGDHVGELIADARSVPVGN
jgi:cytochrome c peroxidase